MAKIKLGPVITDISGPIKNVSFGRYARSSYFCKGRGANISNSSSWAQARIRRLNQEASSKWRDELTPLQRARWGAVAKGLKSQDGNSGNTYNLIPQNRGIMSGYHAFLGAWVMMNYVAVTPDVNFNDAPLGQTPPSQVTKLRAAWVPAITPNYALRFDGVNEYVQGPNALNYEFNQPQSWEFWIKPAGALVYDGIISKLFPLTDRGYMVNILNSELRMFLLRQSGVEGIRVARAFAGVGTWKHAVCTYDGSNNANGMRIYVNSVVGQVVQKNVPITGTIINPSPLNFGINDTDPTTYMQGDLDCIRNYNRVLTQPEVNTLWNGGAGLYGADPFGDASCQGAWMFCTGHNHTLHDISGNGYDGDMINMEPADWVPGKVPCPLVPGHIEVDWDDPAIVDADSRIRLWMKSRQLMVHKQVTTSSDLVLETADLFWVRVAKGAHIPITSAPGHYVLQADVVQPNGLKSGPSRIAEVTVP